MTKAFASITIGALLLGGCDQTGQDSPSVARQSAIALSTIPDEYLGEWTNQPQYCGYDGDDLDSVLTVRQNSVGYFESTHEVRRAEVTGSGLSLSYVANPDASILPPDHLHLSEDGKRIFTAIAPKGDGYARCPEVRR